MNCNLCGDLSSPPVAEGPCYAHTSLYVCTKGRPDNTVHGERCQCHCDQLFCLTHARTHLNEIGSGTMADCFPALSMSLAGPVLTASVGLTLRRADANDGGFTTHGSDSSRRTIALFLSYATPGIEAIRRAQNTIDGVVELEVADDELWPVERLHVTDAFLTSDRLEKIMALATRQITDVWLSRRILVRDFATDERVQSPLPLSLRLRLVDAFADT
ncbi:MAG: hypothetical protein ABI664_03770, partial [bacterium]